MSAGRPVAVLGECVADAIADPAPPAAAPALGLEVHPGGGPANTAVALARLGTPTRFLGRLSTDVFGQLFRTRLAASGVDVSGCPQAAQPSTLAVTHVDHEGRARYAFHAEHTADWHWTPAELHTGLQGDLCCLHTGSLALVRDPGAAHVERLLSRIRARATISLDPNVRPELVPPGRYRDRLQHWCRQADILRASDDDLTHLSPARTPEQAADEWHALGVRVVVITLGPHGVLASLGGTRLRVPAPSIHVVDTVGAGDAFTAGMLHALGTADVLGGRLHDLTSDQLHEAVTLGIRVAAATCATRGANPPWAGKLEPWS